MACMASGTSRLTAPSEFASPGVASNPFGPVASTEPIFRKMSILDRSSSTSSGHSEHSSSGLTSRPCR